MNSRERVLCTLDHRQPDRVPIDVGATRQSGIAVSTYVQLKQRLGLSTPTRVYDLYQMLAEIEQPVLDRLGADVVGLCRPAVAFGIRNHAWKPWRLFGDIEVEVPGGFLPRIEPNGDWVLDGPDGLPMARMPKDGFYFDRLDKYPGAAHLDPESLQLPLLTEEECDHFRAAAEACWQNTDKAIIVALGPPYELFFGLGTGDFPGWMITLATEPEYVAALYDRLADAWLENLRRLHAAVGHRVHIVQFNDDLGTQDAPFLSTRMFREQIMPSYRRGIEWIHRHTPWKVFMHNDGAIWPLIPSLIEMGVDILNPVQTTAKGMDPLRLKQEYGDRLTFWGASCDCQHTLAFGTPAQVAEDVRRHVEVFSPGGGYVFASVHNVQSQVPPENVFAMYDTARAQ